MKKINAPNRETVIGLIKKAGKYEQFCQVFERTPEDYFEEYSNKAPEIWISTLDDLQIQVPPWLSNYVD